jgi:hypothetical protein
VAYGQTAIVGGLQMWAIHGEVDGWKARDYFCASFRVFLANETSGLAVASRDAGQRPRISGLEGFGTDRRSTANAASHLEQRR